MTKVQVQKKEAKKESETVLTRSRKKHSGNAIVDKEDLEKQ